MRTQLLFICLLLSCATYSQKIVESTKYALRSSTIEELITNGDGVKIIKSNNNTSVILINKKDSITISYLIFKQYIRPIFSKSSKFIRKYETLVFEELPGLNAMRVNGINFSFFWFSYTDMKSLKTFEFKCTIKKLKKLDNQIKEFD